MTPPLPYLAYFADPCADSVIGMSVVFHLAHSFVMALPEEDGVPASDQCGHLGVRSVGLPAVV